MDKILMCGYAHRDASPRSKTDMTLVEPFSKVFAIELQLHDEEMQCSRWLLDSQPNNENNVGRSEECTLQYMKKSLTSEYEDSMMFRLLYSEKWSLRSSKPVYHFVSTILLDYIVIRK